MAFASFDTKNPTILKAAQTARRAVISSDTDTCTFSLMVASEATLQAYQRITDSGPVLATSWKGKDSKEIDLFSTSSRFAGRYFLENDGVDFAEFESNSIKNWGLKLSDQGLGQYSLSTSKFFEDVTGRCEWILTSSLSTAEKVAFVHAFTYAVMDPSQEIKKWLGNLKVVPATAFATI